MTHTGIQKADRRFHHLDHRNSWLWALTALVLLALGCAVVLLYVYQVWGTPEGLPSPELRGILAGGLCGMVVLFCLYMFLKQLELRRLRNQLFQAQLGEESLRSRLSGLASLFEGVTQVGMQFDLEPVLQTAAVSGMDAEFVRGARVRVGDGIAGWVVQHNQLLILDRAEILKLFPAEIKPGRNIAAALCVPLSARDQVIGVLNVNRLDSRPSFTPEDAHIVSVFAAHIAIGIKTMTDRRQADVALRESSEQVRQLQKMEGLGKLAGGMAHDFNNLLAVILGQANKLIPQLQGQEPLLDRAQEIKGAAERGAAMTRQLLAFSRKQVLQLEVLDLNASVSGMTMLLRRLIGEDVELITRLGPGLGRVKADRSQIEQVIMNLVVNARDAMPKGGQLVLATRDAEIDQTEARRHNVLPGPYVVLEAADTGCGMDPQTLTRIFEPFFTTKHPGKGTGLGLATVYGIVKQCGGHITVSSTRGRGTTFHIYLPRVDEPAAAEAHAEPTLERTMASETILLAEDEEGVRKLVREMLQDAGYKVLEARSAGDAVVISESHPGPIHLMVTDVVMPGRSGRELAQRMTALRPDMPVLYISGYTDDAVVHHGVRVQNVAFLQKPFTEETLIAKVRSMLDAKPPARREGEPACKAA